MKKIKFLCLFIFSNLFFINPVMSQTIEYQGKIYTLKSPVGNKQKTREFFEREDYIIKAMFGSHNIENHNEMLEQFKILARTHQNNFSYVLNGFYDNETLNRYFQFYSIFSENIKIAIKNSNNKNEINELKELLAKFASNEKNRYKVIELIKSDYLK